ncbi:o-succinylbenzoate--CoA ligase [Fodinisporobacter ferrooxydans]|uniref:2-succinylbenzoate--CoA ligase n=1 Tax=Fodinisporobacter ferrooxydans TaxID=2901836 RepID=A0ABY4CI89_9BACL|nr:o-succinylbenzoate--CoA ligase [Alicyclobacillaceae bacterium MYW30-H2]
MTHTIVPNWLRKRADLTPERPAVILHDNIVTFAELDKRAQSVARRLIRMGVHKGDHVALLFPNGLEIIELIHGLEYIGAVMVLLNTRLSAHELAWQIEDANVAHVLYDLSFLEKVQEIRQNHRLPHLAWRTVSEMMEHPETATEELQMEFDLDQTHTIIYTSGTTGYPKGVQLCYGNHWWSAIGSALNLGLHLDDRWLACVPMFHVSGLSILMRSVMYGIAMVVLESFDPKQVNDAIIRQHVTIVSVVSAMLKQMVDELEDSHRRYPETFRCMLLGGGPAPLPILEACKAFDIPIYQTYGMTETASQIVTLSPEYMLQKLGSAGKPLFQAQLQIVQDGEVQKPMQAGEILVKGPNVTKGYWNRADATAHVFTQGWLHTGDIGYLDEDGFLYVLDRRSDLIVSGGENIYPAELEAVLLSHPAILEAGVTGMEDPVWGKIPAAFVKIRPGQIIDEKELKTFCFGKLASYKIPKCFYSVVQLPRNASNKLLRRELLGLVDATGTRKI